MAIQIRVTKDLEMKNNHFNMKKALFARQIHYNICGNQTVAKTVILFGKKLSFVRCGWMEYLIC